MGNLNLPDQMPQRPADERREGARVEIRPGDVAGHDGRIGGQLVRLILTDHGPVIHGEALVHRADVLCTLRPQDARRHAIKLLQAADQAELLI